MVKLSLCIGFAVSLLVGMNSLPSVVYAQNDQETAQPNEPQQTGNTAQPDQTATPGESATPDEQGDDTQSESTDEPEN